MKHGLSSKYTQSTLGQEISELRADPELLDLKAQIATCAALQLRLLDEIEAKRIGLEDAIVLMHKLAVANGRLIAAHEKIYEGDENLVPVGVVGKLVELFAKAVNDHVEDERARRSLIETIQGFSALPAATLH